MPSGRIHTTASIIAAGLGVTLINSAAETSAGLASGYLTGCLAGLVITPDLDMINQTAAHRHIRRFYRPPAFVWRLLWLPYAIAIPHRSFFSHFPFISTIGRLLYLSIPSALIIYAFSRWQGAWSPEIIAYSQNTLPNTLSSITATA